jgi:acetyl-CoA carboxylase biotin carboxyl carrier protein
MTPELEQLKELYDLMLEKNLDTLELKEEDFRIKLTRRTAGLPSGAAFHSAAGLPPVKSPETASAEASNEPAFPAVLAPLAGIFYRASSPTSAPFTREGDVVEPGQTLCIIEAMKVMNEIKAESHIKVLKILAENGRPVTAGQALFRIEAA